MTDLTGLIFGRLTVVRFAERRGKKNYWICRCECGTEKAIQDSNLSVIKSCGCYRREFRKKHGMYKTPEYKAWTRMKERCLSASDAKYKDYGGRGISVCQKWSDSFEAFLTDMGQRSTEEHELDRIDNNGNYCPENCRWATRKQQTRNTRRNHLVTFRGITKTLAEWCEEVGLNYKTVSERLRRYGWTIEQALSLEPQKGKKPKQG